LSSPKVVALGGGHGLAATLSALRKITTELTAIVTVADNGGSSGRLRKEFNSLPPGDLRMALAALCADDEWGRSWAEIMQYRFTLGRVLPMALEPLDIEGVFKTWQGTHLIRGQKEVALGKGALEDLRLIPNDPTPTTQGVDAIAKADFITLGPGSWFSSVMPHLLVAKQRQALESSKAKKVIILNLDAIPNVTGDELAGSSPADHLRILRKFAPELKCDVALLDSSIAARSELLIELEGLAEAMGGRVFVADLASHPGSNHHDTEKLFLTLSHIFQAEMLR